jgi:hypothetical protein
MQLQPALQNEIEPWDFFCVDFKMLDLAYLNVLKKRRKLQAAPQRNMQAIEIIDSWLLCYRKLAAHSQRKALLTLAISRKATAQKLFKLVFGRSWPMWASLCAVMNWSKNVGNEGILLVARMHTLFGEFGRRKKMAFSYTYANWAIGFRISRFQRK